MCCSIAPSSENSIGQNPMFDTRSEPWERQEVHYCKMSMFPGIYLSVGCFLYVIFFLSKFNCYWSHRICSGVWITPI